MENFNDNLAELLEVDSVQDDDQLQDFEAWDSLTVLSIIAHFDDAFSITVTAQEVNKAGTIAGLKNLLVTKQQA